MVAPDPNVSPPPLRARIAALRTRAKHQRGTARFWSLAVALQLIDDHLAVLHQRATGMISRSQRARVQWAQRSWEQCRAAVLAALRR
jgi:Ni/Fe-hydrogenase subunit HybB-like protein